MDNPTSESNSLNTNEAADAFVSLFDADQTEKQEAESPEAAAERIAAEDLAEKADPETKTEGGEDAPAGDKITIEVDGKTVELTKAELAEHYKNGLRQADYTRKTMETAELRKTADAETQKARAERQVFAQKLHEYSIKMQGDLQEMSQVNLQELLAVDPVGYLEHQRIAQERQANLVKAQQQLGELNAQHQAEQAETANAYRAAQQQELLAKLPEWKDPVKAKAESAKIKDYLATQGFDADKINRIADHSDIVVARKAMLYDELIARAGAATKKVAALPTKVERPGNGDAVKPDGRTESMKRLAKSGSVNDAAAVFSQMF